MRDSIIRHIRLCRSIAVPTRIVAVFSLFLAILLNGNVYGQRTPYTTQGNDFWVMFLSNMPDSAFSMSLIATGENNAIITVTNPRMNWSTTVNLNAGGSVVIPLPDAVVDVLYSNRVRNGGIHVTSTADISLYASNFIEYSYDITTVLPTIALDDRYIAQTYQMPNNSNIGSEVGVLAIQDSTIIYMPGIDTLLLMRGQTYLLSRTNLQLSGYEFFSNHKPFAMFQGNKCANVPLGYCCCDHVYEQSIPVDYWGKNFVVASAQVRQGDDGYGDAVRITSSLDSCDIFIDSILVAANLLKGETYETIVPYNMVNLIHTTKPSQVCLYLSSGLYGGQPGDPASVIIPPIEQGVQKVTFSAHNTAVITGHYTNIVVPTRFVPAMEMDSVNISSSFSPVDAQFSFAQISVNPGTHTLQNQWGGFVAYFYGLGEWESYAYTAAMGLNNLSEGLFINNEWIFNKDTVRINYCATDSALISLRTTSEDTSVRWYIDGRLLNINRLSFVYHFNGVGVYHITALTHGLCDSTRWCDTLECYLEFLNDSIHVHIYDTTCNPTYTYNDNTYTSSGTYYHVLKRYKNCDSVVILHLIVGNPVIDIVNDTICNDNSYYFAGNHITEPGVYVDSNLSVYGCDSITVLVLEKAYMVLPDFKPALGIKEVCLGTTISYVDANIGTQDNAYNWVWDDGRTSISRMGDTVIHTYTKPGKYDVRCEMRAENGCADTSYFRINVYDYTRAEFRWHAVFGEITNPVMFFKNISYIHEPEFNYYKWEFYNDTVDTNAIAVIHDYDVQYRWPVTDNSDVGFYRVRLVAYTPIRTPESEFLCMDSTDHIIYILNDFLQFPNVVTPNNDGINDIFEIKNLIDGKGFTDTELYIYNSWGRIVYHKNNISTREDFWDPELNNDPSGTYYYRFSGKGHTGDVQRNGVVQVLR